MSEPDIQHAVLADALMRLAEALGDRRAGEPSPTYLEMAEMAHGLRRHLDTLTQMLIAASRAHERSSWADIGRVFGVTRQAAMRRWGDGRATSETVTDRP